MPPESRTVAVVGAGVSGLVAARRLALAGARVELLEAGDRVGGQVDSVEVAPGVHLEAGAEALHLSAPGVAALVEELGLGGSMVLAAPGESRLLTRRGLRPLPAGVGPAGPSRLGPVLRSGTLGWAELARAGLEPVRARRLASLGEDQDVSVGDFVTARFGPGVTRTFVDPLLGNLHGGDVDRLSLRACAPMLVPAAERGRSLVLHRRGVRRAAAPSFATWPAGLATLTERLADCPGVRVRAGCPADGLGRTADGRYAVSTPGGPLVVDAVVLAVPAGVAARLLRDLAPAAVGPLAGVEHADVTTVLLGVPAPAVRAALPGTGLMVPAASGRLLKAVTALSRKWPHLSDDAGRAWLRLSAGRAGDPRAARLDDDALVAALLDDLRELTGLAAAPDGALVRRWPAALPQLTVGHGARLASARAALPAGVALAGASYDGLGLAACIRSGEAAAATLAASGEPT